MIFYIHPDSEFTYCLCLLSGVEIQCQQCQCQLAVFLLHNEGRLLGRTRGTRSRPRPRRWRPSSTPSCRPRSSRRTASCGASRSARYIYTVSRQYLRHIYMYTSSGLLHRLLQEGCGGFKAAARQPPLQQAGQGHGDLPGQYGWFVSTLRKSRVSTEHRVSTHYLRRCGGSCTRSAWTSWSGRRPSRAWREGCCCWGWGTSPGSRCTPTWSPSTATMERSN